MAIRSLIKFFSHNPLMLMLRINRLTNGMCRTGFVLTAISEGIYDTMQSGPATFEEIQKFLNSDFNPEGLMAWLELGVSLGEIKKGKGGYSIKGKLSKELYEPANDHWRAFFQVRTDVFYDFIINTPSKLKSKKQNEFNEAHGELIAKASRSIEPVLLDVVGQIIPKDNPYRLLEVGCGSGIYIKRACELNPFLTAVGLEVQNSVADFARKNVKTWNLEDRVSIEHVDIRKYKCKSDFNLVTFYNLIYYFPLEERINLLRDLGAHLVSGGELILTSMCKTNEPSISLMNLWTSMTKGYGPLPSPKQLHKQLRKAGYCNIKCEMLIPSFVYFRATK